MIGPDAARYLAAADGLGVPKPFHLRWLLPALCGRSEGAWWRVWLGSWVVLGLGTFGWRLVEGDGWRVSLAVSVVLLALPGVLGPAVVIPVGVDLPASALTMCGVLAMSTGHPVGVFGGVLVVAVAATVKESAPVFAALWAWSLWPLLALLVVAVRWVLVKPGPDPLGARFQEIADHPVRSAFAAHRGRWRDGWLMVAPWGLCVLALRSPSVQVVVSLVVAHGLLLVATDTVRLLHHAAGPVLAVAAVHQVPVQWLWVACAAHVVWWRIPERV